jgi:hypothetical protein
MCRAVGAPPWRPRHRGPGAVWRCRRPGRDRRRSGRYAGTRRTGRRWWRWRWRGHRYPVRLAGLPGRVRPTRGIGTLWGVRPPGRIGPLGWVPIRRRVATLRDGRTPRVRRWRSVTWRPIVWTRSLLGAPRVASGRLVHPAARGRGLGVTLRRDRLTAVRLLRPPLAAVSAPLTRTAGVRWPLATARLRPRPGRRSGPGRIGRPLPVVGAVVAHPGVTSPRNVAVGSRGRRIASPGPLGARKPRLANAPAHEGWRRSLKEGIGVAFLTATAARHKSANFLPQVRILVAWSTPGFRPSRHIGRLAPGTARAGGWWPALAAPIDRTGSVVEPGA